MEQYGDTPLYDILNGFANNNYEKPMLTTLAYTEYPAKETISLEMSFWNDKSTFSCPSDTRPISKILPQSTLAILLSGWQGRSLPTNLSFRQIISGAIAAMHHHAGLISMSLPASELIKFVYSQNIF